MLAPTGRPLAGAPVVKSVREYLREAHASELALVRAVEAQLAIAPDGEYRTALEQRLSQTVEHAERVRNRLGQLGEPSAASGIGPRLARAVTGRSRALARAAIDRPRGAGDEQRMLENATDACATVALQIAAYGVLEPLARAAGDERTAQLAAGTIAGKHALLESLFAELGELAGAAVRVTAADPVHETGPATTTAEGKASEPAARVARRKAQVAVPPPADFDMLTAAQIIAHLGDLSQPDLTKLEAHERGHHNRAAVLAGIESLRAAEPG